MIMNLEGIASKKLNREGAQKFEKMTKLQQ